jgi:hypothetical protein
VLPRQAPTAAWLQLQHAGSNGEPGSTSAEQWLHQLGGGAVQLDAAHQCLAAVDPLQLQLGDSTSHTVDGAAVIHHQGQRAGGPVDRLAGVGQDHPIAHI